MSIDATHGHTVRPAAQVKLLRALDELIEEIDSQPVSGAPMPEDGGDEYLKRAVSKSGQHKLDLPPRQ
jgi:hypothetical protein